jgi:hypothetical protein
MILFSTRNTAATVAAFMLLALSLPADDAAKKQPPDMAKVLPGETLMNNQPLRTGFTCGYLTDREFGELKAAILKSLGEGWEFKDIEGEEFEAMKKGMAKSEMNLASAAALLHPSLTGYKFGVTLVPAPEKTGKKYLLSIITFDKAKAAKAQENPKVKAAE